MRQTDEITIQEAEEDLINHFLYSTPSQMKPKQNWFFNLIDGTWKVINYICWFIIFGLCFIALLG